MPDLLILTVGTGTAGRHSNIAEGLKRTIELVAPRAFWLLPSTSEDSLMVADYVRENLVTFAPLNEREPFLMIAAPDDLEDCRLTIRRAIQIARGRLCVGERLLLNPTSGTKQMTAAATLAALDENLGELVFTVGDRADGVVVTGTERLAVFDASTYFQERDLMQARDATRLGAFTAAERLLSPHRGTQPREYAIAECLRQWQRQNYSSAAAAAARFDDALRRHLRQLSEDAAKQAPSPSIIVDLLAWSAHHQNLAESDAALRLAYKALEIAARNRLHMLTGLLPPYLLSAIDSWGISNELRTRLRRCGRDNRVFLGLNHSMQVLDQMGDVFGSSFQSDPRYHEASQKRNELTHSIAPISSSQAQRLVDLAANILNDHFDLPSAFPLPRI